MSSRESVAPLCYSLTSFAEAIGVSRLWCTARATRIRSASPRSGGRPNVDTGATPRDCYLVAMGVSYTLLLIAFYVDNGKSLPLWRAFPPIAYWLVPSVLGALVIVSSSLHYCGIH